MGPISATKPHRRASPALLAMALCALLAPSPAPAAINPLAPQGSTTLQLSRAFTKLLKRHRVALKALAPATLRGQTLRLPVSGGRLDSDSGRGAVAHAGALKISSPKGSLTLREFTIRTTSEPLIANTNGPTMKLAAGQGLSLPREGFGQAIRYRALKLTANFARRLDKRLGLHNLLRSGEPLGSLQSRTRPASVAIRAAGELGLELNPQTLAKLGKLHVSVNPIFPAEHQGSTFSFPIILGGRLAPDLHSGTLRSGGSLELQFLGEGQYSQLFLHEPWLDFEARSTSAELNVLPSPPFQGKSERPSLFGIGLGGASPSADPGARTITLTGASLALGAQSAAAFDEAFAQGKEEFKVGDPLGTFGFTVGAQ
jgi:hypothetical protein